MQETDKRFRVFFSVRLNLSCPADKFPYCFGDPYDFLVVTDSSEYGSLSSLFYCIDV